MESATRFLDCRVQTLAELKGWEYNSRLISDKELKSNTGVLDWQPSTLDRTQCVCVCVCVCVLVIQQLCNRGEISLDTDKDLEPFVIKGNYLSLNDFLEKLTATGLVYVENKKLKLLTDQCQCLILPDGRTVARRK